MADDPHGPYTFAARVFGTFPHNPTVRRLTPEQSGDGSETFVKLMYAQQSLALICVDLRESRILMDLLCDVSCSY